MADADRREREAERAFLMAERARASAMASAASSSSGGLTPGSLSDPKNASAASTKPAVGASEAPGALRDGPAHVEPNAQMKFAGAGRGGDAVAVGFSRASNGGNPGRGRNATNPASGAGGVNAGAPLALVPSAAGEGGTVGRLIKRDMESAQLVLRARKLDLAAREWVAVRGLLLRRATARAARARKRQAAKENGEPGGWCARWWGLLRVVSRPSGVSLWGE